MFNVVAIGTTPAMLVSSIAILTTTALMIAITMGFVVPTISLNHTTIIGK